MTAPKPQAEPSRIETGVSARRSDPTGPAGRFLTAVVLSQSGNWLTTVAVMMVVYRLTQSPAGPAAYMFARVAPRLLGTTLGGSLADRFGPARVAALGYAVQGVATAAIIVAAQEDTVVGICIAVGFGQAAGALSAPCEGALVPLVARPEHLSRVNSLRSIGNSSAMLVGPALGALALAIMSPVTLIWVDVASFAVAAALLFSLPGRRTGGAPDHSLPSPFAAVRPVFRDSTLRSLAVLSFVNGGVVTVTSAVLVGVAGHFGATSSVGWLYAAVGAGGLIGGALSLKLRPRLTGRALLGLGLAELASLALLPFSPMLLACAAALLASGVAAEVSEVWGNIAMQRHSAPELLGRVNGLVYLCLFAGMVTGSVTILVLSGLGVPWSGSIETTAGVGAMLLIAATSPRRPKVTSAIVVATA